MMIKIKYIRAKDNSNLTLSQFLHYDENWEIDIEPQLEKVRYIIKHIAYNKKDMLGFILEEFENNNVFDIEVKFFIMLDAICDLYDELTDEKITSLSSKHNYKMHCTWELDRYLAEDKRFLEYQRKEIEKNAW